jgi:ribosome maturation factor RimP
MKREETMAGTQEQALLDQVKPILEGMGFVLVELRLNRSKRQTHISIVIYRPQGVGIDDCAAVSRNLLPRLELLDWLPDLRMEVSSPGLDRVLRGSHEFEIFKGRGIRVWKDGADDWIDGINGGIVEGVLHLQTGAGNTAISMGAVRKVKLDASSEAGI